MFAEIGPLSCFISHHVSNYRMVNELSCSWLWMIDFKNCYEFISTVNSCWNAILSKRESSVLQIQRRGKQSLRTTRGRKLINWFIVAGRCDSSGWRNQIEDRWNESRRDRNRKNFILNRKLILCLINFSWFSHLSFAVCHRDVNGWFLGIDKLMMEWLGLQCEWFWMVGEKKNIRAIGFVVYNL